MTFVRLFLFCDNINSTESMDQTFCTLNRAKNTDNIESDEKITNRSMQRNARYFPLDIRYPYLIQTIISRVLLEYNRPAIYSSTGAIKIIRSSTGAIKIIRFKA